MALNGDVHHLNVPLLPDNASVTTTSLDDGPSFAVPQLPTRGDGGTLKVPSEMSNGVDMPTDLGDTTEDDDGIVCSVIFKQISFVFLPNKPLFTVNEIR